MVTKLPKYKPFPCQDYSENDSNIQSLESFVNCSIWVVCMYV